MAPIPAYDESFKRFGRELVELLEVPLLLLLPLPPDPAGLGTQQLHQKSSNPLDPKIKKMRKSGIWKAPHTFEATGVDMAGAGG